MNRIVLVVGLRGRHRYGGLSSWDVFSVADMIVMFFMRNFLTVTFPNGTYPVRLVSARFLRAPYFIGDNAYLAVERVKGNSAWHVRFGDDA